MHAIYPKGVVRWNGKMTESNINYQFFLSRLKYLLNQVYREVPKLLSLMDNQELSKTYGCFFPPYWKEKRKNFVNARAQEAALTLAMLYSYGYPNNPYYDDKKLLDYAVAGMDYWTKLQHRDGSFDEWRRFEHGQACTAFSTLAMIDTFKLTKSFLSENLKDRLLPCFKKSEFFCVETLIRHILTTKRLLPLHYIPVMSYLWTNFT